MVASMLYALLALAITAVAQEASIVYPTTAAASATALATSNGYVYAGCYNETTGLSKGDNVRALQGNSTTSNNLTISTCITFCSSKSHGFTRYAGIEYGRECYCSNDLNVLSTKLDDSSCMFACDGNSSEICGGRLALSLYNRTSDAKEGVAWSVTGSVAGGIWWMAGLVMMGVVAAL